MASKAAYLNLEISAYFTKKYVYLFILSIYQYKKRLPNDFKFIYMWKSNYSPSNPVSSCLEQPTVGQNSPGMELLMVQPAILSK